MLGNRPRPSVAARCAFVVGLVGASALAIACGRADSAPDDAQAPRPSYTLLDSAGVPVIVNHEPIDGGSRTPRLSDEPVLAIGTVTGEYAYEFTDIRGLVRLSDGRIAVLDGVTRQLRVFSPDGTHLFSRGGEGLGPGEFRSAGRLWLLPGDTLQIEDFPSRIRYAPDGTLVSHERADWGRVRQLGEYYAEGGAVFVGDDIIGYGGTVQVADPVTDATGIPVNLRSTVRIPWDYSRVDTLATIRSLQTGRLWYRGGLVWLGAGLQLSGTVALGGRPVHAVSAQSNRYAIQVRTLDGTLLRVIRRPAGQRWPEPDERSWQQDPMPVPEAFLRMGRTERDWALAEARALPEPDSISSAGLGLFIDEVNRVWASVSGTSVESGHLRDVFTEEGHYLGAVRLPERFRVMQIGEDFVLGVRIGDLDVQYVEMYRLSGG